MSVGYQHRHTLLSIQTTISLSDSHYNSDEWPEARQTEVGMVEGTGEAVVAVELLLYHPRYKKESN